MGVLEVIVVVRGGLKYLLSILSKETGATKKASYFAITEADISRCLCSEVSESAAGVWLAHENHSFA